MFQRCREDRGSVSFLYIYNPGGFQGDVQAAREELFANDGTEVMAECLPHSSCEQWGQLTCTAPRLGGGIEVVGQINREHIRREDEIILKNSLLLAT